MVHWPENRCSVPIRNIRSVFGNAPQLCCGMEYAAFATVAHEVPRQLPLGPCHHDQDVFNAAKLRLGQRPNDDLPYVDIAWLLDDVSDRTGYRLRRHGELLGRLMQLGSQLWLFHVFAERCVCKSGGDNADPDLPLQLLTQAVGEG